MDSENVGKAFIKVELHDIMFQVATKIVENPRAQKSRIYSGGLKKEQV